ncbi:hypothetical protein ACHAPV_009635 [Trichoderma viride]
MANNGWYCDIASLVPHALAVPIVLQASSLLASPNTKQFNHHEASLSGPQLGAHDLPQADCRERTRTSTSVDSRFGLLPAVLPCCGQIHASEDV